MVDTTLDQPVPPPPRRIWFGVLAGPVAWFVVQWLGWLINGQACADGDGDWGPLSGGAVRAVQLALSAAALLISLAALRIGLRTLRREHEGRVTPVEGRARPDFLAATAVLVSTAFAFGILLTGFFEAVVPICERAR